MQIINFSDSNSIINQYLAEMRDVDYQKNRLLFRNNIQRIGELEAYEISKTLTYQAKDIATPLGISHVNVPTDKIVLATIFRAGLPFTTAFSTSSITQEMPLFRLIASTPTPNIIM